MTRPVVVALAALALGGSAPAAGGRWCEAPAGAQWRTALSGHVVALSRAASIVPLALAGDGRTFFASLWSKGYAGVVRVDARTSSWTPIRRFPEPDEDQAVGSFDGRWLVWEELRTFNLGGPFDVFAWDSRTGRVERIGSAPCSPPGACWPNAPRAPDVRAGLATWEQGIGPDGLGEVHVYDLAHDRDDVVRRGHPQGSFLLAGGMVVWPESIRRGAFTTMESTPAPVPPALRGVRGVSGLATDGQAIAFPTAAYTALSFAPRLTSSPRLVYATGRPALHIENGVQVAGDRVFFSVDLSTGEAGYLADAKAGRYVRVTTSTFALLDRKTLLVLGPGAKALHPRAPVRFVPLSSLPAIPACRR